MTNLHYLLIGLAALLVGGVFLYNRIQEWRLRKQIDGMFRRSLDNALADPGPATPAAPLGDGSVGASSAAASDIDDLPTAVDEAPDTYDDMINLMRRVPRDDEEEEMPVPSVSAMEADRRPNDAAGSERGASGVPAPRRAEPVSEPVSEPAPSALPAALPEYTATAAIGSSPLDAETECIARVRAGPRETAAYAGLLDRLRRIGKPVRAYGHGVAGVWEPLSIRTADTYAVVELGLQLVDRKGAVTLAQLDAYCNALYEFAAQHGGAVTCPDLDLVLSKATELDAFCMAVDMVIGLNLVAPEGMPFLGRRIDELARKAGMTLNKPGAYALTDAAGRPLFSLANQRGARFVPEDTSLTTPSITLLFDVPNLDNGLAVFDRMTTLGFDMARTLGGRIVDDQGHLVTQESLTNDRRQLAGFYARMQAHGVPAGGDRARRLFA